MTDLVASVRLTADGKGLVGEVRASRAELEKLGATANSSNTRSATAADRFTASLTKQSKSLGNVSKEADKFIDGLRRQADTFGLTRGQAALYDAQQLGLKSTNLEVTQGLVKQIDAQERQAATLQRLKFAAAAAATAIVAFTVTALRGMIRAAQEGEESQARLNAVLTATGFAAGRTREQLEALAGSLARTTNFNDEQIRDAISVLLTFKNVGGEAFEQTLRVAADLAVVMKTDLSSAVVQLGKALEDPVTQLTALRRSGVSFSEQQIEVIKNLVETGRQGEALNNILGILRGQGFNGVAEAMRTGIIGATSDLRKAWVDMLETMGRSPVTQAVVVNVLDFITTRLRAFNDELASTKSRLDILAESRLPFVTPIAAAIRAFRDNNTQEPVRDPEIARANNLLAQEGLRRQQAAQAAELAAQQQKEGEKKAKAAAKKQAELDKRAAEERQKLEEKIRDDNIRAQVVMAEETIRLDIEVLTEKNKNTDAFFARQSAFEADLAAQRRGFFLAESKARQGAIEAEQRAREESSRVIEQSLTDSLLRGFERGESFGKNFAKSLQNLFATLVLRPLIQPVAQGGADFLSGLVRSLLPTPAPVSTVSSAASAFNQGFLATAPLALGGIMTSQGPLELERYSSGGVATRPQLALFGEGARPEAFVPLPDGRSIPVTVSGSSATAAPRVVVNIINNAQASVRTQERTQNGEQIVDVMIEQMTGTMARDISRGAGLAPMLERRYGLSPAAGALR